MGGSSFLGMLIAGQCLVAAEQSVLRNIVSLPVVWSANPMGHSGGSVSARRARNVVVECLHFGGRGVDEAGR
jgi:hypothetical protein